MEGKVLTLRTYRHNDAVRVHPTPPDGVAYGTIVGTLTQEAYEQHRDYWGDVPGTGPLYIVNVGNVFTQEYEVAYAESDLTPLASDDPGVDWTPGQPVSIEAPPF